ncbi:hypothetical protein GCM10010525_31120 [Glutamicibacter bergerei]
MGVDIALIKDCLATYPNLFHELPRNSAVSRDTQEPYKKTFSTESLMSKIYHCLGSRNEIE